MNRRLRLLMYTFKRGSLGGPVGDWIFNLFSPRCEVLARRCIEEETVDGEFRRLKFKACQDPLYYPAQFPTRSLYQTVAEQFYPKNWHYYEIPETQVEGHDVVVDCGSAEGLFALVMARRARRVVAVEPLGDFQKSLRRTFTDLPRVELVQCALGRTRSTAFLKSGGICSKVSGDTDGEEIQILPLDQLCGDRSIECSYLKADVEGFEQELLEGAAETIRRNKPKIANTTYHGPNDSERMATFLKTLVPEYQIRCKGIESFEGKFVMLHAWVKR